METTIVLADDHQLFLEGLRSVLSSEPDLTIVAMAMTGDEAIAAVRRTKPHIVVMDLAMPGLNGVEATRQIVAAHPATRVLCLSMHGDEEFVVAALERGASGYLLKECATDELVRAIRCITLGQTYLSPAVAGAAVSAITSGKAGATEARRVLTGREAEVLQLIAEGHETREISERLHVSMKTVATHRANIIEKLGVRGIAGLTRYAIRHGIASLGDDAHD